MHAFFAPGLLLISFFDPWARNSLVVALFAAAFAAAGLLGLAAVTPWVLLACAIYLLGAVLEWGQIGMKRIRRTMERLASGDLSARIDTKGARGTDAIRMWTSIDSMSRSLGGIVTQVNASSAVIGKAAHEIAHGYTDLSHRTEEQASTLEETASATEELTATVQQNAEGCRRAAALASEASAVAARAAETMRRMTETMERIEDGSRRVGEISAVIEGIAFQTNILALNAAVEAARAGEHGHGFAVVASEVRSLAQRCSDAAREIRKLLDASASAVHDGGRLVADAATTIDNAASSVGQVSREIEDIARSSSEQSSGIEGISKAIQQLEGMTQQNAGLVEETGRAARSFEEQAARLGEAVGLFKLDQGEARDAAVALVRKGIARMQATGNDIAFAEFEDKRGGFIRGDYYLWVCDAKGIVRSHGINPKARNLDYAGLKDANGRPFIRDVLRIAAERGKGWVDYVWRNPVSKRDEAKSTYFERTGDLIVLCGIYRAEGPQASTGLAAPRPQKLLAAR